MRWRDKIILNPVHLTLFTVISMETRNIQILMTRTCRTLDLVTSSNLKRWRNNLLRSPVAQATTQTQAEQKLLVQLWAENHELLESGESRTCSVEKSFSFKLSHKT